ncbi:MAG: 16S rRNA (guanine(527)-N(7))-methyltransferase RsmG [Pseudomonadota bacterium]
MSRETTLSALDVSRETTDRLDAYVELLLKWNRRINLIGRSTTDDIWTRHVLDCAQLVEHAPAKPHSWIDLGSGAGLPGIVVAILNPNSAVTLVEADQRKATFLRAATSTLGLSAEIEDRRIEAIPPTPYDIISARALAPLPRLLELAAPFRGDHTRCLFPKGRQVHSELTAARADWHIEAITLPSRSDADGTLLAIDRFEARA